MRLDYLAEYIGFVTGRQVSEERRQRLVEARVNARDHAMLTEEELSELQECEEWLWLVERYALLPVKLGWVQ